MNSTLMQRTVTGAALIAFVVGIYLYCAPWVLTLVLATALIIILMVEWPKVGHSAITPWYPILPFALLVILNHSPHYRFLLPAIVLLTAAFDTGAYFIGSRFGTIKVTPRLSPNKTLEGIIGGFLVSLPVAFFLVPFFRHLSLIHGIFLVASIGVAAFMGDIFVSWLKRRAGVKDCSNLLPGHGGLLDRFDSILFVTILLFALRNYLAP